MTQISWKDLSFWETKKWKEIKAYLRNNPDYVPGPKKIFRAMSLCPLNEVKVVILGQDPYPTPGDADGLAFSSARTDKPPPSLANIFKELKDDLNIALPENRFSLEPWAREGVLLLNTHLTTMPHEILAHSHLGWDELAQEIVQTIAVFNQYPVFVFWGKDAGAFEDYTDGQYCLKSAHPSPRSANRGFLGSRPFSKINRYLVECGERVIDWRI